MQEIIIHKCPDGDRPWATCRERGVQECPFQGLICTWLLSGLRSCAFFGTDGSWQKMWVTVEGEGAACWWFSATFTAEHPLCPPLPCPPNPQLLNFLIDHSWLSAPADQMYLIRMDGWSWIGYCSLVGPATSKGVSAQTVIQEKWPSSGPLTLLFSGRLCWLDPHVFIQARLCAQRGAERLLLISVQSEC